MKILLAGSGPIADYGRLKQKLFPSYDRVIAVDGGAAHLRHLGFAPDLMVGDFDSILPETAALMATVPRLAFPPEKDETDAELALDHVASLDPELVHAIGLVGSRWDHSLANLLLLTRYPDLRITLVGAQNCVRLCRNNETVERNEGIYLSLIPLNEVRGLTIEGVKYPLTDRSVPYPSTLTVSNEIIEPVARITFASGSLLLFLSED